MVILMEVINDILGYKNRKIVQDTNFFSFSLDSIMLANFVNIRYSDEKIIDLGTGNGIIPLILSLRTNANIEGVELQKKLCLLANKSIQLNNLNNQITIINDNIKSFVNSNRNNMYDVITCNPPYFKFNEKSYLNLQKEKIIARHEIEITLAEIIITAKKLLKDGGNFAIVHRTERLVEILDLLKKNKLEPKRIRFVFQNLQKESTLVLIEAQKNSKSGLKIEKPFILYNNDNTKTFEYDKLIREVNYESKEL